MSKKKPLSTFDREMQDPDFFEKFEDEYKEFLLSEVITALMKQNGISVRKLAKEINISPTVIQDIRSGKRASITLVNADKILKKLGSSIAIKVGDKYISLVI